MEHIIEDNFKIIFFMGKANMFIKIIKNMLDFIKMVRKMNMEFIIKIIKLYTKDTGKMVK